MSPATVNARKPQAPCKPGDLVLWFDDEDGLWRFATAYEVDGDGVVRSVETPTGDIVPRVAGSLVYAIRDEQLIESPSVPCGALHRFGFMDISSARVALLPYLDLTRKGTRDDLNACGVVVRGES